MSEHQVGCTAGTMGGILTGIIMEHSGVENFKSNDV